MRYVCPVAVAALLTSSVIFGQNAGGILSVDSASSLSITNYQFVSEQKVTRTTSYVTYRADLLNSGPAVGPMTATVTSLVASVQAVTGQDSLKFGPAAANAQVTALNTFTILVDRTVTFDFASLKWSFQVTAPVANAGANQSATVGSTVTLNGSGS
ncbi:MAG: hypothetical protein JSR64_12065, partial [Nitrospira sp.]|nr:hypothetical protein [Nitrospira sp.]